MDCIFCKIIARQIPAEIVYEDEGVLGFLDIKPNNPGHTLVIPKMHHNDFSSTPPEALGQLAFAAQKIAKAVIQATGAQGFNLTTNNGAAAGQLVFHVHMHVIPRHPDDGFKHWPGTAYKDGEMEAVGEKIRKAAQG